MQVLTSLLVSALLLGFKLNVPKELTQTIQRRKELQTNLALLQTSLDEESLASLLDDLTYDAEKRRERITEMASAAGRLYSQEENEILDKGLRMFAMFKSSSAKATQLTRSVSTNRLETKQDEATGLLLGRCEAKIRAAPQELVAEILNFWSSRSRQRETEGSLVRIIRGEELEIVNPHHKIVFARYAAKGVSDRTFLFSLVAKQVGDDPPMYVLVLSPVPRHAKIGPKDEAGAIRAENHRVFRFTQIAPAVTRGENVCSLDLRGWVPKIISDKIVVPTLLGALRGQQSYFQQILPPSSCDAEDGHHVGHQVFDDLVDSKKPEDLPRAIRRFADRSKMLRESGFRNIGEMLVAMLAPDPPERAAVDVATAAHDAGSISKKQAASIGSAFLGYLHTERCKQTVQAASNDRGAFGGFLSRMTDTPASRAGSVSTPVNRFVRGITSLCTMRDAHEWFVPMLKAIAARLMVVSERQRGSLRWSSFVEMSARPSSVHSLPPHEGDDDDDDDEEKPDMAADRPEESFMGVVRRFVPSSTLYARSNVLCAYRFRLQRRAAAPQTG